MEMTLQKERISHIYTWLFSVCKVMLIYLIWFVFVFFFYLICSDLSQKQTEDKEILLDKLFQDK